MRYGIILLTAQMLCLSCFCQSEKLGTVPPGVHNHENTEVDFSIRQNRVRFRKALRKKEPALFDFRLGIGTAFHIYNPSTRSWLDGNHNSIAVTAELHYKRFVFGTRGKVWTRYAQENLVFSNDTLSGNFLVNPVKADYYIGYRLFKRHGFSLDPFVGYTFNEFRVINQDSFGKRFAIPKVSGPIIGASLTKYVRKKGTELFSINFQFNYAFVDFSKVNRRLGFGYFDMSLTFAYDFAAGFKHRNPDINYAGP